MSRLENKTILVTGAAGGLGRSHCIRLATEGANVIAVDICKQIESVPYSLSTPEELQDLVNEVESAGGKIIGREADVRDPESLSRAIEEGLKEFGGLDGVVANAGIAPMARGESRAWADVIDVNLTGVFNTIEASLPVLLHYAADSGSSWIRRTGPWAGAPVHRRSAGSGAVARSP